MTIVLAGQPNAGKSTIFNLIAGVKAATANFPGTTVKYSVSHVKIGQEVCDCIDLPGTYSLQALDLAEVEARDYLLKNKPDVVINVIDASLLCRSLEFTLELLELELPMVVCLNMMDEAVRKGYRIDTKRLEELLGVPVVPAVARTGEGIRQLFVTAIWVAKSKRKPKPPRYHRDVETAIEAIIGVVKGECREKLDLPERFVAIKLLERDPQITKKVEEVAPKCLPLVERVRAGLERHEGRPSDEIIRAERHALASDIFEKAVKVEHPKVDFRQQVDRLLTHRYLGYVFLALIIYGIFYFVFRVGGALEGPLLAGFDQLGKWLQTSLHLSGISQALVEGLVQGIAGGFGIVLPYLIPFLLAMSALEDIGYLPRAAFLMDAFFHRLGLHGKAIIPFVLGYGCNVPAVMATRILEEERDRITATILSTLVPCSARNAIVFGLVAYYLGPWAAVSIYVLNIAVIAAVGKGLSRFFPTTSPGLILEIPQYRWPSLRVLLLKLWLRLREFITIAWPLLIAGSIVLSLIQYYHLDRILNDVFSPLTAALGLPAVVGVTLVFGILRKELSLIMLVQALGTTNVPDVLSTQQIFVFTVFVVFYFPCVSTFAAMVREIGLRWSLFGAGLTVVIATVLGVTIRLLWPLFGM